MSLNFQKQVNFLIPLLKNRSRLKFNTKLNLFATLHSSNVPYHRYLKSGSLKCTVNYIRKVSSSSFAKANDSNTNGSSEDKVKNVLNDDEFRSILSDFAKDFGVSSDSEPILDEIRKSLDENSLIDNNNSPIQDSKDISDSISQNNDMNLVIDDKFKEFSESDAAVIPSFEELPHLEENDTYSVYQDTELQLHPRELKRGKSGVYDIHELIEILRKENVDGVTTISVPEELHYTDFLVITTAKSPRHSKAVCERIIKLYKMKKNSKDPFAIVEGEKTSGWKAIDMGNIVLHVFLEETRALYDIESLWLFDSEFDQGGNQKPDPLYEVIEEQMAFFNALNESEKQPPTPKTS